MADAKNDQVNGGGEGAAPTIEKVPEATAPAVNSEEAPKQETKPADAKNEQVNGDGEGAAPTIEKVPEATAPAVNSEEAPKQETKPIETASVPPPVQGNGETVAVCPRPENNKTDYEWKVRESELLKSIADLEKVKNEASADGLKLKLKVREEEIDLLKTRIKSLETELTAAMSKPGAKNHELVEKLKQQHDELLSKARGMIFDKTKMVKNQELQIAALTSQVASLKDVAAITRDLLDIRNAEVKHLEDRLEGMEGRLKAERDRHALVLQRTDTGAKINDDLRREYETQLALFKELREKYDQRVKALVEENKRLTESTQAGSSA